MKINISISSETATTRAFHTFRELLAHLHLEDWFVQGQPMLEYGKSESILLYKGNETQTITIQRDAHGYYAAEVPVKDLKYYVLDKYSRVIQAFNTTARIPVPMLRAIRYHEAKYHEQGPHLTPPQRIVRIYKGKYKKGDTILGEPFEFVNWTDCENGNRTRIQD